MCGNNPTRTNKTASRGSTILLGVSAVMIGLTAVPARAQTTTVLEEITVTAQKREEALQDVPISVATLSGERYNVLFSGGEDVLALSGRVPGLYAESSNGRAAPRFYMRGLGNIDFDLGASQPVLIVMDEVVLENVVLKSFPLFDMQQVEVIRGPQGTLFGRNTTAGIIKFNTVRPSHDNNGYIKGSWGTYDTINVEGAVGGSLIDDKLSARVSVLKRSRADWITNGFTGQKSLGDYDEAAGRVQLHWTPTDRFGALLSYQVRDLDGTASIFRANVFNTGSDALNQNYDRETVWYDGGDDNPQGYSSWGATLNLQWDFDDVTAVSITSLQDAIGFSRGDIDGGVVDPTQSIDVPPGLTFDPDGPSLVGGVFVPALTYPGYIVIPSVTEDGADTDQFTQEFRLASNTDGPWSWQLGMFYFDSDLKVETEAFSSFGFGSQQNNIVQYENKTWAVFGQASFDVTDQLTLTGGVRYTDDEKDFQVLQFAQLWIDLDAFVFPQPVLTTAPINVDDGQMSWELSANYAVSDEASIYGRAANGFRAQTVQGRDVAFGQFPTVAKPEEIDSYEIGYKADLLDNRLRVNVAAFWYEVEDMQLSIIGGATNTNQVINADKGEALGAEIDVDFLVTENFLISGGVSFNDSEIKDPTLATVPCGSGLCTPTDPVDPTDSSRVLLNGNPFPRAPESTYNLALRWGMPIGNNAEIYALTDWAWYGKINLPLYESLEFQTDGQFEGGLRVGYRNFDSGWEFAVFGRNITDEDNVLGFIDFSNNTGFVNEPTIWGIEAGYEFGD